MPKQSSAGGDAKLVIATDEAGYGPQLGPLVIGTSSWLLPRSADPARAFAPLADGFKDEELGLIRFNDSKTLFSPKTGGLRKLEAAMLAVVSVIDGKEPVTLREWLDPLEEGLATRLSKIAWLDPKESPFPIEQALPSDWEKLSLRISEQLQRCELQLLNAAARIVPADEFNRLCASAGNKATLLSEETVRLAIIQLDTRSESDVEVFSDKHGGRAYYGGLLQHFFPDAIVHVIEEGRSTSRYRIEQETRTIHWNFTAKGDSFPPVALASMVAKYTRERLMGSLNAYWQSKVKDLKPTAGYPGDAARFLKDIAEVLDDETRELLVRKR